MLHSFWIIQEFHYLNPCENTGSCVSPTPEISVSGRKVYCLFDASVLLVRLFCVPVLQQHYKSKPIQISYGNAMLARDSLHPFNSGVTGSWAYLSSLRLSKHLWSGELQSVICLRCRGKWTIWKWFPALQSPHVFVLRKGNILPESLTLSSGQKKKTCSNLSFYCEKNNICS